ncbi:right-handed parallel beta-helix repeat-containing protein [Candidatus Micrarchaeota archaeon]|nr:right-handed parallel beta-helix repeat-containing protein [Candidatus Micrarchaeota archaeon]
MSLPNRFGRRDVGSRNSMLNARMSRGSFVRGAGIAAGSAIAAGLGLGGVANAADPWDPGTSNPDGFNVVKAGQPYGGVAAFPGGVEDEIWVYPTGNFNTIGNNAITPPGTTYVYNSPVTMDSRNIQWAVNNVKAGGKVVLKAPTNSLIPGHVLTEHNIIDIPIPRSPPYYDPHAHSTTQWGSRIEITQDVEIAGDPGNKIIGGHHVFQSTDFVKWAVRNINFEKSGGSAISIWKSSGLEVDGCSITNMKPEVFYAQIWTRSVPVGIVPLFVVNTLPTNQSYKFGPDTSAAGYANLTNNIINPNVRADFQFGIIYQTAKCDGLVSNNEIYNCSMVGVTSRWTKGNLVISNNYIVPGTVTQYAGAAFPYYGVGIALGDLYDGGVYIGGNTIECNNPKAIGMGLSNNAGNPNPAVIEQNNVTMFNTSAGALQASLISNSVWKSNKIQGKMDYALSLIASNSNTFQGNNIAQINFYDSESVHIVLTRGSSYNALAGFSGLVADDGTGTGNVLTGYTTKAIGPALSERLKEANQQRKLGEEMEMCILNGGTWDETTNTCST